MSFVAEIPSIIPTPSPEPCGENCIRGLKDCSFNGKKVKNGESVRAFLSSSVPYNQVCSEEMRVCENGVLHGSYEYSECLPGGPHSCLFNGKTIKHGESVDAFLTSSVSYGEVCNMQKRLCNDGHLDGTFSFATCNPGAPASCIFNGKTILHGGKELAFETSTVAFGSTCNSELRECNNGIMSGSFNFASCTPNAPAACIYKGRTIPHGGKIEKAYETLSVPFGSTCKFETRECNNGHLSGSYEQDSCSTEPDLGCSLDGVYYANGAQVKRFKAALGSPTCESEWRTCNRGTFSGSFTNTSCQNVEYRFPPIFVVGPCEDWDYVTYPCDEGHLGQTHILNYCGYTNKAFTCHKKLTNAL